MATSPQVPPFRVTPEDLADLEKSTRNGLEPLLQALNDTIGQLVPTVNATPLEEICDVTLKTGLVVADSFPLKFATSVSQPKVVVLGNCLPKDPGHSLTTPFALQGFRVIGTGVVSIQSITGMLPSNTYSLTFLVR